MTCASKKVNWWPVSIVVLGCGDCVLSLMLCNSGFEGFTSFAKIVGIALFAHKLVYHQFSCLLGDFLTEAFTW